MVSWRRSQRPSGESAPATTAPTFEIISGLHRGVHLSLDGAVYRIGSTATADIVLRDPGVAPEHAVVRIDERNVRIEAVGGDIAAGPQILARGRGCRVRLPLELAIGEARLRIAGGPAASHHIPGRSAMRLIGSILLSRPFIVSATIAGSVLAVSFLTHAIPETLPSDDHAAVAASTIRLGTATAGEERPVVTDNPAMVPASRSAAIDEAAQQLTSRLAAAGLHTLQARPVDGRLAVSGNLSRRQAAAWTAIEQWFDQTYRGRIQLSASVTIGESAAMPMLQLRAIWFGERPYVITAEGSRFYQGAFLDNGWVIEEIGAERVLFARDGETVVLSYR
jgi:hypothetical protein